MSLWVRVHLIRFKPEIMQHISQNASPEVIKVLAGNKCEDSTRRVVSTEEGKKVRSNSHLQPPAAVNLYC